MNRPFWFGFFLPGVAAYYVAHPERLPAWLERWLTTEVRGES